MRLSTGSPSTERRDLALRHALSGLSSDSMGRLTVYARVGCDRAVLFLCAWQIGMIEIPYAAKLLFQELMSMQIAPRLMTSLPVRMPMCGASGCAEWLCTLSSCGSRARLRKQIVLCAVCVCSCPQIRLKSGE